MKNFELQNGYKWIRLAFRAEDVAKEEGVATVATETDSHLGASSLTALRSFSRKMFRDSPIYHGLIRTLIRNLLGARGLVLQAKTGEPETNALIEGDWKKHLKTAEARSLDKTPRALAEAALKNYLLDGEANAALIDKGRFQFIEAPFLSGNNDKTPGVELDPVYRNPKAFYVGEQQQKYTPDQFVFYPNRELHDQTRGIPFMTASLPLILGCQDYINSEIDAARAAARVTFVKKTLENKPLPTPGETSGQTAPRVDERTEEWIGNLVFNCHVGEELTPVQSNRPAAAFREAIYTICRVIGAAKGIPPELLFLDWSAWNYSSFRGQFDRVYEVILELFSNFTDNFWTPLYLHFIQSKIAAGDYEETETIQEHTWLPPSYPILDAEKEMKPEYDKLDRNATTQAAIARISNVDPEDMKRERDAELADAWKRAEKFSADIKNAITPQELFYLFAGYGMGKTQAAVMAKAQGAPSSADVPGAATPPVEPGQTTPQTESGGSGLLDMAGGMTGYVQIMASFSKGDISREAAIEALVTFFKITPEKAAQLVGQKPATATPPPATQGTPK